MDLSYDLYNQPRQFYGYRSRQTDYTHTTAPDGLHSMVFIGWSSNIDHACIPNNDVTGLTRQAYGPINCMPHLPLLEQYLGQYLGHTGHVNLNTHTYAPDGLHSMVFIGWSSNIDHACIPNSDVTGLTRQAYGPINCMPHLPLLEQYLGHTGHVNLNTHTYAPDGLHSMVFIGWSSNIDHACIPNSDVTGLTRQAYGPINCMPHLPLLEQYLGHTGHVNLNTHTYAPDGLHSTVFIGWSSNIDHACIPNSDVTGLTRQTYGPINCMPHLPLLEQYLGHTGHVNLNTHTYAPDGLHSMVFIGWSSNIDHACIPNNDVTGLTRQAYGPINCMPHLPLLEQYLGHTGHVNLNTHTYAPDGLHSMVFIGWSSNIDHACIPNNATGLTRQPINCMPPPLVGAVPGASREIFHSPSACEYLAISHAVISLIN